MARFIKKVVRSRNVSARVLILIFFGMCVTGIAIREHDRIGILVWNRLHTPQLALMLHRDARFAVTIGNYYFNIEKQGIYNLDRASFYFKTALDLDPHVPDAWHQLSRIDFLRGHFIPALEEIDKQIEIHGDSFMASYYIRGLIEGYRGDWGAAEKDFKTFLSWDSKNWAAHNDLAWIYFSKGDYHDTEQIARDGLVSNPENPWLLTSLGLALLNEGKKKEARTVLGDALRESEKLKVADWRRAYPGNDPLLGDTGLKKMQEIIKHNLSLAD